VITLGVTLSGEKVILGFVQAATENARVCPVFLRELVARGLRVARGLLVILDGAKRPPGGRHERLRRPGRRPAVPVAQTGERCPRPAEGPAGSVAAEAPGRLRAAHLRGGERGAPPAPARVAPPE